MKMAILKRAALVVVLAVIALAALPPAMAADSSSDTTVIPLMLPKPSWYTPDLHQQILASGTRGVDIKLSSFKGGGQSIQNPEINCLGYSPPGVSPPSVSAVSAGGCMVSPHGCSMNFIFADSSSKYIGTAGHCVEGSSTVVAQVATRIDPTDSLPIVTLAAIGRVAKKVNNGIGRDFALVKINSGFAVDPGVAGAAGPTGAFCGRDPHPTGQPVTHYGHGYVFFVEQGYPKFGEVIPDLTPVFKFTTKEGFNWVGYGLPGDSGSDVMNDAALAVGDLTHGIAVAGVPVPGLSFGTTTAGIFDIIGTSYSLVTVDGRQVKCSNAVGGLVGI
jgi:hypothetical protein